MNLAKCGRCKIAFRWKGLPRVDDAVCPEAACGSRLTRTTAQLRRWRWSDTRPLDLQRPAELQQGELLPRQVELLAQKPTDQELVLAFRNRRAMRLHSFWGVFSQPRNPIASDLHDCARYAVMRQIAWEVRGVPPLAALGVIEEGAPAEERVIERMQIEGWTIVESGKAQATLEIRQPLEPGGPPTMIVRGKPDGRIVIDRPHETMPFDVKATSEYVFRQVDSAEDLVESIWTRKWLRQLHVYMNADGRETERSMLVLHFRGDVKPIVVRNDLDVAEWILERCAWTVRTVKELEEKRITTATVDAELNERGVPYESDWEICRSCDYRNKACFPPDPAQSKEAVVRPDLEEVVRRYAELKPGHQEYERLHRKLKALSEGVHLIVAGDYLLEGKVTPRRYKAQEAHPAHVREAWSISVRKVGEAAA